MSAEGETADLKAGHPPAMKVGNVRKGRTNSGSSQGEKLTSAELAKQAEEFGTVSAERPSAVIASGAIIKETQAFPPEAVKSYHDKPQPHVEKHHAPAQHMNIQQPRK